MQLLDDVTSKIKELKESGIAISTIKCSSGEDLVEIKVGTLETRDIFASGEDSNPAKTINSMEDLDFYHTR